MKTEASELDFLKELIIIIEKPENSNQGWKDMVVAHAKEKVREVEFSDALKKVMYHIRNKYLISVYEGELEDGKIGEFNGTSITIQLGLDSQAALFLLTHLFGHNVQWVVNQEWRTLGLSQPDFADFELVRERYIDVLPKIHEYEYEACQYGLQLLHEADVTEFDQFISDMAHADWAYLQECYLKGYSKERHDKFMELYFKEGTELIQPKPIPYFTPESWETKYAF